MAQSPHGAAPLHFFERIVTSAGLEDLRGEFKAAYEYRGPSAYLTYNDEAQAVVGLEREWPNGEFEERTYPFHGYLSDRLREEVETALQRIEQEVRNARTLEQARRGLTMRAALARQLRRKAERIPEPVLAALISASLREIADRLDTRLGSLSHRRSGNPGGRPRDKSAPQAKIVEAVFEALKAPKNWHHKGQHLGKPNVNRILNALRNQKDSADPLGDLEDRTAVRRIKEAISELEMSDRLAKPDVMT